VDVEAAFASLELPDCERSISWFHCQLFQLEICVICVVGGGGLQYDGEQTWPLAATMSLDKPDLVEVRAPKPTQVLLTTEDNCFPFAGGQRATEEAQAAFDATGSPENLDVHIAVYHHGWCNRNREAMYLAAALAAGRMACQHCCYT
jgi:hypothetical protein